MCGHWLGKSGDLLYCSVTFFYVAKEVTNKEIHPLLAIQMTPAEVLYFVLFGYFYTKVF